MKKMTTLAVLIVGAIASGQALAGGSATLDVKATIVPGACNVVLPSASLDWDNIDPASLHHELFTELPAKQLTLNVNCPAKMMFAVKAIDNATKGVAPLGPDPSLSDSYFDFTSTAEKNAPVGGYSIKALTAGSTSDQTKATALVTFKNGKWNEKPANADYAYFPSSALGNDAALDISTSDSKTKYLRDSAMNKSFSLEIRPWIAPVSEPAWGNDVDLKGSATFEVVYI
ncbi:MULTISPECIES: DUF1120 domain-containing protein [Erwinia]|uniref:Type 1 fimbria pilin n=1 Tax=Erwinia rhapontici TaxID=55212 RepID=A0ABM7N5K7_ERWRD|nr:MULTISPECIES: DUF1120 domain-containing protein [Erwinia]MCS3608215.1 type 1 fimbria pilin [Erwinia rhapontici]NNS08143.1 DUF1120 domain-containing protein [Erwinia sp. JH02]TDT00686.1 uncharacterized protein DUF1120 [Erwinia rhapontici]BCQ36762.1 hypothetical protein ERHA53_41050 [Erwinia rhapontici]BCQ41766.1 hypothetical protein ERHA54_43690 [Erwinia rhapontici]